MVVQLLVALKSPVAVALVMVTGNADKLVTISGIAALAVLIGCPAKAMPVGLKLRLAATTASWTLAVAFL
jgi:hypothetical protein